MKKVWLALALVLIIAAPTLAQAAAPAVNAAQQAFLAGILRFIGQAMLDHADDWAGVILLAIPPLSGLIGWLMPREWLFGLVGGVSKGIGAMFGKGK